MAEPDFTNTDNLADVIKREPSPIPGPSWQHEPQQQQPVPPIKMEYLQDLYDEEDDSSQDEELPDEFHLPEAIGSAPENPTKEINGPLRVRPYDESDLKPVAVDGRCAADWPLAHLWPVYVGNFRCADCTQCWNAIRHFFGSKGLLVHWFFQLNDDYYFQFQKKANLYDGLVYFGSEQDAQLALQCDHSIHNGYTLNVFPGRDPVYFPPDRSAMFREMRTGYVYSEEFFTRALVARHGAVRCVVKFDIKNGAAEFYSVAQAQKVFATERQFKPTPVGYLALQKQRYVESNLLQQIRNALRTNPSALPLTPADSIYRNLNQGNLPKALVCPGPPPYPRRGGHGGGRGGGSGSGGSTDIRPVRRGPSKYAQKTKLNAKLRKMRREIERDIAEGKQPVPNRHYPKADKKRWRAIYAEIQHQMSNRW